MQNQEVFDTIVNHLRKQGKQALDAEGCCLYRTKDGLKCAFGVLIDDDEYFADMEDKSSKSILGVNGTTPRSFDKHENQLKSLRERLVGNSRLIDTMQKIHDYSYLWESDWENVAREFGLKYTPPV